MKLQEIALSQTPQVAYRDVVVLLIRLVKLPEPSIESFLRNDEVRTKEQTD